MRTARTILYVWLALVLGFFVWQNTVSRGVADRLLEWQHGKFAGFWPTTTLIGLSLLFGIPALVIYALFRRRRRRSSLEPPVIGSAVAFSGWHLRLLQILAGLAAGGAIISLLLLLTLPTNEGPVRVLPTGPVHSAVLPTGATRLDRLYSRGPLVRFTRRLLWNEYVVRYLPVSAGRGEASRLFVQIDDSGVIPRTITGVTGRDALPPSVRNVYIARGILAPGPHYVLFSQPDDLTRPYLLSAVQFAFVGVVLLLGALWQRRTLQRARRKEAEIAAEAPPVIA